MPIALVENVCFLTRACLCKGVYAVWVLIS